MKLKTMSVTDLNVYIKRNFDHDFILSTYGPLTATTT